MVIRDLRVHADWHGGKAYHYRDSDKREVDAIIQHPNGSWAGFEIKLGFRAADQAADSLKDFASKVDTAKIGEPLALAVIAGTDFPICAKTALLSYQSVP